MSSKSSSLQSRSARAAFRSNFGSETVHVVSRIARGQTTEKISSALGVPSSTVAAYRANVTRDTYAPFVTGSTSSGFTGSCNF